MIVGPEEVIKFFLLITVGVMIIAIIDTYHNW